MKKLIWLVFPTLLADFFTIWIDEIGFLKGGLFETNPFANTLWGNGSSVLFYGVFDIVTVFFVFWYFQKDEMKAKYRWTYLTSNLIPLLMFSFTIYVMFHDYYLVFLT